MCANCAQMHDGQNVTVQLAEQVPCDDMGHTMLSRWAIIACVCAGARGGARACAAACRLLCVRRGAEGGRACSRSITFRGLQFRGAAHGVARAKGQNATCAASSRYSRSEAQMKIRDAALEEEYAIQEATRKRLEEEAAAARQQEMEIKAAEMRKVIATQLHDGDKVYEALNDDWYNMNRNSAIDTWVKRPLEQRRIKETYHNHYVQLSELFKTYGKCLMRRNSSRQITTLVDICRPTQKLGRPNNCLVD